MVPRFRGRPGLVVALAASAACLLVLCSFIVFEVLDLDGSDFPRPTRAVGSLGPNPAEPPFDVKRAQVHGAVAFVVPSPLRTTGWVGAGDFQRRILAARALGHHAARATRITLPRSSVAVDPPPAA